MAPSGQTGSGQVRPARSTQVWVLLVRFRAERSGTGLAGIVDLIVWIGRGRSVGGVAMDKSHFFQSLPLIELGVAQVLCAGV